MRGGVKKDKGMLKTELVEKSYRVLLVEKSERVSTEAPESENGGAGEYVWDVESRV